MKKKKRVINLLTDSSNIDEIFNFTESPDGENADITLNGVFSSKVISDYMRPRRLKITIELSNWKPYDKAIM